MRIDACDRCQHSIKTIDLTKDGLAVPCVDDIASVPLDLWAREPARVGSNPDVEDRASGAVAADYNCVPTW